MDVGGDRKRTLQGMTFGGADVVGTLGHTIGLFLVIDTLRVGTTMIAFIGTLGIGAGGSLPTGCMEIARDSGRGGRGASRWKPGGGCRVICCAVHEDGCKLVESATEAVVEGDKGSDQGWMG